MERLEETAGRAERSGGFPTPGQRSNNLPDPSSSRRRGTKYRHIIWDWNGTLLNDTWLCVEIINGILQKRNKPTLDSGTHRALFDFPILVFYRRLGLAEKEETFQETSIEFMREYNRRRHECALQKDAREVLREMVRLGLEQSVLSAYNHHSLVESITHYGLADLFHKLIGQNNFYGESKVENGRKWLADLTWEENEILLVGDTRHDFEVASAMGVNCLLLSHGAHSREKLVTCGVPVLEDLKAVKDWIA